MGFNDRFGVMGFDIPTMPDAPFTRGFVRPFAFSATGGLGGVAKALQMVDHPIAVVSLEFN